MPEGLHTAHQLRDAISRGDLTSREAVEHSLSRIEHHTMLGTFICVTADTALTEATAADKIRQDAPGSTPDALPPLHGLPIAHKDLVDVRGTPTTLGSAAIPHTVAEEDHPGVAKLRRAGTISLGKTQVPEFGLTAYSENLISPPARNPWDHTLTPGGSSGGTAAAIAAGILTAAPGSDGGGSIRIPALACGLIGLKPGLGAIPTDLAKGRVDEFGAPQLVTTGPMARNVEDAALLYDAMRGTGDTLNAVRSADTLPPLRVGVNANSPFHPSANVQLSPTSAQAYETAAKHLESLGHYVEHANFSYDPQYTEMFTISWTAGLSLLNIDAEGRDRLEELTRLQRDRALTLTRQTHRRAAIWMHLFGAKARKQWGQYDIVLTPGLTMPPPRVGEFSRLHPDDNYRLQYDWSPFTSMVNVSGLPAIAVPILGPGSNSTRDGLPAGVQLIGRAGSEAQLLQLAWQLTHC